MMAEQSLQRRYPIQDAAAPPVVVLVKKKPTPPEGRKKKNSSMKTKESCSRHLEIFFDRRTRQPNGKAWAALQGRVALTREQTGFCFCSARVQVLVVTDVDPTML